MNGCHTFISVENQYRSMKEGVLRDGTKAKKKIYVKWKPRNRIELFLYATYTEFQMHMWLRFCLTTDHSSARLLMILVRFDSVSSCEWQQLLQCSKVTSRSKAIKPVAKWLWFTQIKSVIYACGYRVNRIDAHQFDSNKNLFDLILIRSIQSIKFYYVN